MCKYNLDLDLQILGQYISCPWDETEMLVLTIEARLSEYFRQRVGPYFLVWDHALECWVCCSITKRHGRTCKIHHLEKELVYFDVSGETWTCRIQAWAPSVHTQNSVQPGINSLSADWGVRWKFTRHIYMQQTVRPKPINLGSSRYKRQASYTLSHVAQTSPKQITLDLQHCLNLNPKVYTPLPGCYCCCCSTATVFFPGIKS